VLEKYHLKNSKNFIPMPELKDENQEYEVEKIKDNTVKAGYIQYLVKWLGWLLEYNQ